MKIKLAILSLLAACAASAQAGPQVTVIFSSGATCGPQPVYARPFVCPPPRYRVPVCAPRYYSPRPFGWYGPASWGNQRVAPPVYPRRPVSWNRRGCD